MRLVKTLVSSWVGHHANHVDDEKPQKSGVKTTGSPNNGFRNIPKMTLSIVVKRRVFSKDYF